MPDFHLVTHILRPPAACFDLSLSIEAHIASTRPSRERAVAGVTSGIMQLGEEVTWEARHLGRMWRLTSRISELESAAEAIFLTRYMCTLMVERNKFLKAKLEDLS